MMIEWGKARQRGRENGAAKKNQTLKEGKGETKEGKEMSNNRRTTLGRKQEV